MKLGIAPNPILSQRCAPCPPLDVRTVIQAFKLLTQLKGLGLGGSAVGHRRAVVHHGLGRPVRQSSPGVGHRLRAWKAA
jgi:hypothetical protein